MKKIYGQPVSTPINVDSKVDAAIKKAIALGEFRGEPGRGIKVIEVVDGFLEIYYTDSQGPEDIDIIELPKGLDGRGIQSIEVHDDNTMEIYYTDGTFETFQLPGNGDKGDPGRGISSVESPGDGTIEFHYTDGEIDVIQLPTVSGVTSWNDLKDKPFGYEKILLEEIEVTNKETDGWGCRLEDFPELIDGETYTVVLDGKSYTSTANYIEEMGQTELSFGDSASDELYGFIEQTPGDSHSYLVLQNATKNTYKFGLAQGEFKLLDSKYLPPIKELDEDYKNEIVSEIVSMVASQDILPESVISEDSGVGTWDGMENVYELNLSTPLVVGNKYIVTVDGVDSAVVAVEANNYFVTNGVALVLDDIEILYKEGGTDYSASWNTLIHVSNKYIGEPNQGNPEATLIPFTLTIYGVGNPDIVKGDKGDPGRGIEYINVTEDGDLEIEYTDGTAEVFALPAGVTSWNDLTDKPFGIEKLLFEETEVTNKETDGDWNCILLYFPNLIDGETYTVILDGKNYTGHAYYIEEMGHTELSFGDSASDELYGMIEQHPGNIRSYLVLYNATKNTYKLSLAQGEFKLLDSKYLPPVEKIADSSKHEIVEEALYRVKTEIAMPEAATSWNDLKDKPFGFDEVLLETENFSGDYADGSFECTLGALPRLVDGETYTVIVDGKSYTGVANQSNIMGTIELDFGDLHGSDLNGLIEQSIGDTKLTYTFIVLRNATKSNYSIKLARGIVKTISSEYLPPATDNTIEETIERITTETVLPTCEISETSGVGVWDGMECLYQFNLPMHITAGTKYIVTINGVDHTVEAIETGDNHQYVPDGVALVLDDIEIFYREGGTDYDETRNAICLVKDKYLFQDEYDAGNFTYSLVEFDLGIIRPGTSQVPRVALVATLADGSTKTFRLYGEAV